MHRQTLESQSLSFPARVFIQFCFFHSFKVCLEKRKPKQKAALTSGDSASWHPQLTHLKELTQPLAVPVSSQKLRQASVPARGPSAKAYSHGESDLGQRQMGSIFVDFPSFLDRIFQRQNSHNLNHICSKITTWEGLDPLGLGPEGYLGGWTETWWLWEAGPLDGGGLWELVLWPVLWM